MKQREGGEVGFERLDKEDGWREVLQVLEKGTLADMALRGGSVEDQKCGGGGR